MVRVRQMLVKLQYRATLRAFDRWLQAVHDHLNLGEHVSLHDDLQAAQELRYKQLIMSTALRWNQRALSSSFLSWQSLAFRAASLAQVMAKVTARVLWMRVGSMFGAMKAWSCRQRVLRRIGAKSLLRLRQLALSKVVTAWSEHTELKLSERSHELRLVAAMLGRWRRGTLWRCFGRWRNWMVGVQHVRKVLTGAKQRVDRARVARALFGWAGYRAYCHLLAQRYRAILDRKNSRLLVWSLLSWSREAKAQLIKAKRLEIAGKVAELHMARADRERAVASLRQEFNSKANALEEDLDKSNYEIVKSRAQARMFREEATKHYRNQQTAMVERTQSEQAAVSALLDEAVTTAERNAQAAADALASRLGSISEPHTGLAAADGGDGDGDGDDGARLIPKEQAQHVRSLLRQINPITPSTAAAAAAAAVAAAAAADGADGDKTEGSSSSSGSGSGSGVERPISVEQAKQARTMLLSALSPPSHTRSGSTSPPTEDNEDNNSNNNHDHAAKDGKQQESEDVDGQQLSRDALKRGAVMAWAEATAIPLTEGQRQVQQQQQQQGRRPPSSSAGAGATPLRSPASIFSLSSSAASDDDDAGGGGGGGATTTDNPSNPSNLSNPAAARARGVRGRDGRGGRGGRGGGRREQSEMKRITVWIHAMAERRAFRGMTDCFEAWVGWLLDLRMAVQ
jgi:hypothetical protein